SGFAIFLTGITGGYDTTSLSYALCTIFMAIALTKYDLLDTLELVRNYVIDNLSLEIIATDEDDRIIYYNQPLHDIYPDFNENSYETLNKLISLCKEDKMLERGDKVYKPEYKELIKNGKYRGHILTLSDITDSYNYTQLMKKMTEIDPLTGLYNRFAYEYRISEIKKMSVLPENLIIFAMDVNGLKAVNDSKGHEVGDAMIKDAAECIKHSVGSLGECYRVGGDEFAVVITENNAVPMAIKNKIEAESEKYHNQNYELSISVGYCCGNEQENMDFEDYEQLADKMMFREKENYYIKKGINRRERDKVFNDICDSYTKILKVNLLKESFEIIKMSIEEKNNDTVFSRNLREWLGNLSNNGIIHKDDVETYSRFTNLDFLKKEFSQNGKKVVRTFYRRKVGEEYHKTMLEIYPKKEYSPEEPIVFMYVKDMED
ncbi:MAG: diguanylate cyclase, partial [Acutalibacteraceae bacterium]